MGITVDIATTTSSGGGTSFVQSSGSHLFQIDGYSIAKHAPIRTSLKSCPFTVGGFPWMIQLFPNGDGLRGAGFISVFIGLYDYDKGGRVSLQVEFSFIDEVDKQNTEHLRTRQVVELYGNYGVGYRRFIAREALEKSKHLKGDRFTIRCDFIITAFVCIPENGPRDRSRKCGSCNLRPVRVRGMLLLHACFCDACDDASRDDPTGKQCAGCHGPYEGRILLL
ncbi:hypothetical protein QYE76_060615 [Lolium multiflorum]|jgi:hypothetical protein|uniref:MATH domain-containing protein n=1 Tax=Lolium multiflorum TaxID=4521 RepID=A0AAD8S1M0_LOLMU|nr:hypothetical protein QYE76_060615 [Lolium multiflorum]